MEEDTVDEHFTVRRFPEGAGSDGGYAVHGVGGHEFLEAFEDFHGPVDGGVFDGAPAEYVAPEGQGQFGVFDERPFGGAALGDEEADGAGADVDNGDGFVGGHGGWSSWGVYRERVIWGIEGRVFAGEVRGFRLIRDR